MNVLERLLVPVAGEPRVFVSRAGQKLDAALATFNLAVAGQIIADLGCNVGGFVDCLLQRGAARVYAVDTGYGTLAWKLRQDPRVYVMERTNALFTELPEAVDMVTIDVGWTRQEKILPVAAKFLKRTPESLSSGRIISLFKPHYESAQARVQRGVLSRPQALAVLQSVADRLEAMGFTIGGIVESPLRGQGGNAEFLLQLAAPA